MRRSPLVDQLSSDPSEPVGAVLSVVRDALASRGSRFSSGHPALVHAWTSRTAHLYRVRVDEDESNDVVVKVLRNHRHAAPLARTLNDLADMLSEDRSEAFLAVPALGSSDTIGCVVMPYVNGPTIRQILEGQRRGFQDRRSMLELVARCGSLLARYHARFSDTSRIRLDEAWRDLDFRVKAVFGQATVARHVLNPSTVSKSYSDFHPGHVIVTKQRRLALIDPPCEQHYLFVARDIACFTDKLLVTPRSAFLASIRRFSHAELSAAFLRGYDAACTTPLTPGDRVAIDVNLLFLLKRRLHRIVAARRWVKLMYYGVPLACHYRRLINRLRAEHAFARSNTSSFFGSHAA